MVCFLPRGSCLKRYLVLVRPLGQSTNRPGDLLAGTLSRASPGTARPRGSSRARSAASRAGRCRADAAGRRHALLERLHEQLVVGLGLLVAAASRRRSWARKRSRWTSASISSLNAFAISIPPANASQRSTRPGSERCSRASGESSIGIVEHERRLDQGRLDVLRQQIVGELGPGDGPRSASSRPRSRSPPRRASRVAVGQHDRSRSPPGSRRRSSRAATASRRSRARPRSRSPRPRRATSSSRRAAASL